MPEERRQEGKGDGKAVTVRVRLDRSAFSQGVSDALTLAPLARAARALLVTRTGTPWNPMSGILGALRKRRR